MVLLNLESGFYYGLNPLGSRVWELLADHGENLHDLYATLLKEHEVAPEELEQDLLGLVRELETRGLVRIVR